MKRPLSAFLLLLLTLALFPQRASAFPWVLSPEAGVRWSKRGALLLDARGSRAWSRGHLLGSRAVSWQDFSQRRKAKRGLLLSSSRILEKTLRRLGISHETVVLVVGDVVNGWGEEGRIVWMLRTLGHRRCAIVDGGNRALRRLGLTWTTAPSKKRRGSFTVRWNKQWQVSLHEARTKMTRWTFLDTRERREFLGKTPYGETRGGHVPGAKHIHFRRFLNPSGRLRKKATLLRLLRRRGIRKSQTIVAYCTGGIRSAWVVVVLKSLGFSSVKNYDGSMWEWSAKPAAAYPLLQKKTP